MQQVLSPKELAQVIGVSESSLKRWADEGRLKVSRTAGGHRRIPIAEAIRFIRDTHATVVRPDLLGLPEVGEVLDEQQAGGDGETALFEALQDGNVIRSRGLIIGWYLGGEPIGQLFDGPVRSALQRMGALWRHDEEGIFVEHRATDICIQALNHLRAILRPPEPGAPIAMGGGRPGDPYVIPSLMVSIVLNEVGFRAVNLGPDTPIDVLRNASHKSEAALVWLSATAGVERRQLDQEVRRLAVDVAARGANLVVGGQQVGSDMIPPDAHVHLISSMSELTAFARGLRSAQADHVNVRG